MTTIIAGLEARHLGADLEHLAEGAVARVDLAAARGLGDVVRVGEHRVVDVVLGRGRQDPQVHVARPELAQLELIELDHVSEFELETSLFTRSFSETMSTALIE